MSRRRKALGQHFLSNTAAARRIVDLFAPAPGTSVIEIGPGHGALTGPLLESGARVTAVEVDERLAGELEARFGRHPTFSLIRADILTLDLAALTGAVPSRVIANLPYSITGAVLVQLFAAAPVLTDMTLMLQREVVNRVAAAPGGRVYGSLSVLSQYFTTPRVVMRLGPGSFIPPPAVSSAVVVMPFRAPRELEPQVERLYPGFIRMIFAHRRRTLLNNLKAGRSPAPERALARAGIDPGRRPETLAREECLRLFLATRD